MCVCWGGGGNGEGARTVEERPQTVTDLCVFFSEYNRVQNIPGDHFFIRANFTRVGEGEGELDFHKDDILVVENTVHRGTIGLWLAWLVDEHGNKIRCGSIPSRLK